MAQKMVLIDDLTGETIGEIGSGRFGGLGGADGLDAGLDGGGTVRFGVDGASFEIDLTRGNAETLRSVFAPFVEAARPVAAEPAHPSSEETTRARPETFVTRLGTDGRKSPELLGAIRSWARRNGHDVPSRGRIPATIVAAYDAEH